MEIELKKSQEEKKQKEEEEKRTPIVSKSKISTPGLKALATPKTGRREPSTPRHFGL